MDFHPNLPEYSDFMYLQGYNPYQIMEAFRRSTKKKYDKKKEESILEKEMFNFIEGMVAAAVNKAVDDIFKDFNK